MISKRIDSTFQKLLLLLLLPLLLLHPKKKMTIDDDNSIYVGGLPYDCSEDTVRKAFDLYGAVVAVKIHNDRGVGAKCYGFVTFSNPNSAIDAINDMNGRTIGGRPVRVNEVRTRGGGRSNFIRENTRRDTERGVDLDRDRFRDRDRDRDNDRERAHDNDRDRYRDRNRERSRDRDAEREMKNEHLRARDRSKDRFPFWDRNRERDRDIDIDIDKDRDQERIEQEVCKKRDRDQARIEQEMSKKQDRDLVRDHYLERVKDREVDRDYDHDRADGHDRRDKDKDQQAKSQSSSLLFDRRSRELSSTSSDDYGDQVKEQLELSIQKREELQEEVSQIDEKLEEKQQLVSDLQKKSQKLEYALASAKKLSSQRRVQLGKFQRYIVQVNDYSEKLKKSQQELQSFVDTVMVEAEKAQEAIVRDGAVYTNGMEWHLDKV